MTRLSKRVRYAEKAGSFFDMKLEIFETEDGQQLKFYENDKGKLYIEISDGSGEQYYTGWIALDKQDAIDLSKSLMKVAKKLPEF